MIKTRKFSFGGRGEYNVNCSEKLTDQISEIFHWSGV